MTVTAPSLDTQGALLDAQIATVQALVTANFNPRVLYALQQQLNALQVQAVDHYMVTGWLNAGTILAAYTPPNWDKVGQGMKTRVAFLQALTANAPAMPAGNDGWTSLAVSYGELLYAKQIELVEHIMDFPGATSAATMLAALTGFQSFAFEYVFSSVGHADTDE